MNIFTNSEYTHVENGMVIVKSCSKPSKKWCALCLSRCLTMLCRTAANVFSWRQLVDFYIQTCYNSYRPSNRQWSPLLRENRSRSFKGSRHGQSQTQSTGLRHVAFLLWRKVPESEAWNGSVMAILMLLMQTMAAMWWDWPRSAVCKNWDRDSHAR